MRNPYEKKTAPPSVGGFVPPKRSYTDGDFRTEFDNESEQFGYMRGLHDQYVRVQRPLTTKLYTLLALISVVVVYLSLKK